MSKVFESDTEAKAGVRRLPKEKAKGEVQGVHHHSSFLGSLTTLMREMFGACRPQKQEQVSSVSQVCVSESTEVRGEEESSR